MSRRRDVTSDERALFEAALKDSVPATTKSAARPKSGAAKKAKPGAAGLRKRPPPGGGLDGRTAQRLSRGTIEPDARLDLHGMTEAAAHRALLTFLRTAAARGCRLALVVTGKGLGPAAPDEPFDLEIERRRRGVLRTMAPRWLAGPALASLVADVRQAHRRHGGDGALYVYLRKQAPS